MPWESTTQAGDNGRETDRKEREQRQEKRIKQKSKAADGAVVNGLKLGDAQDRWGPRDFPLCSGKIEAVEVDCWILNPGFDQEKPLIYIYSPEGRELFGLWNIHGTILPGLTIGMVPIGPGSSIVNHLHGEMDGAFGTPTGQKEGKSLQRYSVPN